MYVCRNQLDDFYCKFDTFRRILEASTRILNTKTMKFEQMWEVCEYCGNKVNDKTQRLIGEVREGDGNDSMRYIPLFRYSAHTYIEV